MRSATVILCAVLVSTAVAARCSSFAAENPDAVMDQFFSIWDNDARVTPASVREFYADRVIYYGESLSNAAVYANKRRFIQRWPDRQYRVVPGSVRRSCDASKTHCSAHAVLAWRTQSSRRGAAAHGLATVSLTLVAQDGSLKIVREGGHPVTPR